MQIAVCGVILIGVVVSAKQIDRYIYSKDEKYSFFNAYSSARAGIVDKKDYGYWAGEEEYKELGMSENDYLLLRTWNAADPDFYNLDLLQQTKKIINDYEETLGLDRDYIKAELRARNYWSYPALWGCFILTFLTICFIKRFWVIALISAGITYLYIVYFVVIGRIIYLSLIHI